MALAEAQLKRQDKSSKPNKPLTERFRPRSLSQISGHKQHVDRLKSYVEKYRCGDSSMPHLMFYGPAGTGKTSAAHALARDLYGDQWRHFVLDTNASDDRGIDSIRGRVKEFARTGSLGESFTLIVLDEMDNLTPDAQGALRRIMEDFSTSCRFILCCNDIRRVIPPIQSRCARFRFEPLTVEQVADTVIDVMKKEGIEWEDGAAEKLGERSKGSLRDALNLLEACPRPVTVESVESTSIDPGVWEDIVARATSPGGVREAERLLVQELIKGASSKDIFQGFFDALSARMNDKTLDVVLPILGEYEYRCAAVGSSLEIQSRCFLRHLAKVGKVN